MDLKTFARVDNETCLLATQKRAERAFRSARLKGAVSLRRVIDAEQKTHFFWLCDTEKFEAFLPVFSNDSTWSSEEYTMLEPVQHGEFICQGSICYICSVDEKGTSVLRVEKFLYQELIEAACRAQNIAIGEIYPALLQNKDQKVACWVNETKKWGTIFPVDFEEVGVIDEIDFKSPRFQSVVAGDRICSNGIYYAVEKTPDGKFILNKSQM